MTQLGADVETIEDTDIFPYEDDGNKDRLTHMINAAMNGHIQNGQWMDVKDILFTARMTGQHVVALCGYRFKPVHDPDKGDICQRCMDVAKNIMKEDG